jgi:hypothetical protein
MISRSGWWPSALVALLVSLSVGCSFSYSSKSSYKSSVSSSDSSSRSSESPETRYQHDVREYTAAWARSGGQIDVFQRKLGELAKQHGIANWEENDLTYEAIGQGLADSNVSKVQFEAYRDSLGRSAPAKIKSIQGGYDSWK